MKGRDEDGGDERGGGKREGGRKGSICRVHVGKVKCREGGRKRRREGRGKIGGKESVKERMKQECDKM